MTEQRHRIRRQVLEVAIRGEAAARALQSRLGRCQRRRIVPLVDRCLSEASAPGRIHRLESLEVDLGEVDLRNLERDLVEKLGDRLRQALAERLSEQERGDKRREGGVEAASRLELLELFARTGSLPWWADATRPRLVDESLDFLISRAPRPLAASMWRMAGDRRHLQRIVLHCGDETLAALFAVLVSLPQPPPELEALLRARRAVAGVTAEGFRSAAWRAVLRTSCRGRLRSREPMSFWKEALTRTALEMGTTYVSLVSGLHRLLRPAPDRRPEPFATVVESLYREIPGVEPQAEPSPDPAAPRAGDRRQEIERLLDRLGRPDGPLTGLFAALRPIARRLPARLRGRWLAALRDLDRHRLGERLPPPDALKRCLAELEGAAAVLPAPATKELMRLFREAIEADRAEAPAHSAEEEPVDLTFSDADVAYVENAGLVIIWPFLGHFFERLDLMEDKQFKEPEAVQRAVGILQYIATEDPSPPEYQVTLGKVLCGMEPNAVFDFGPPVTEAEAEECTSLLEAAIGHAPILNDMSVAGFRGSFLIRKGALSAEAGTWLLRVERETFDVVLDRFPWSVSWLKLPWMEVPIQVEW